MGLQLAGFVIWSAVLYNRYSLTIDYAGHDQAWYLVAHGHLNPLVNNWGDTSFLRNHGEVIYLLLAPLYWIWPYGVTILWVQDLAAIACELVAFNWMLEVVQRLPHRPLHRASPRAQHPRSTLLNWRSPPPPVAIGTIGLILLVANPWTIWTVSFDFHIQTIATCLALLGAFDLSHGRRRAWLWILLLFVCGDVATTFVFGLGLSAVAAGRSTRKSGIVMMLAALGFVATLTAIGANVGSGLSDYVPITATGGGASRVIINGGTQTMVSILKSAVTRPQSYLAVLWSNGLNIYANVLPAGVIGFGSAWGFGIPVVVLLSNDLRAGFSATAFQNFPIFAFLSVGSIMVLTGLALRRPRLTWIIGCILVVNAMVWSAIWVPKVEAQWLRVPASTASALRVETSMIPSADEVVASQGITGPLPQRTTFFALPNNPIPIRSPHVWFVITPEEGIEVTPASVEFGQLAQLVGPLHGTLEAQGAGTFVVKVTPPRGQRTLQLATRCPVIPGWALPSDAGRPDTTGPVSAWGMRTDGRSGYLIKQGYEREERGSYVAAVTLTSQGPLTLEVWDADRSLLLARQEIPPTHTLSTIQLPFTAPAQIARSGVSGLGIWQISPVPTAANDQMEIRIFTSGHSRAIVHSTQIVPAPSGTTPKLASPGTC